MEEYRPTYWNGVGKYQSEYDRIRKEYIPESGFAKNQEAEVVRCLTRIYYDVYNNGGINLTATGHFMGVVGMDLDKSQAKNWEIVFKKIYEKDYDYPFEGGGLDLDDGQFMRALDAVVDHVVHDAYQKLFPQ